MIDKNKLVGASLVALAVALGSSAAYADRGDRMGGMPGMMMDFDFATVDADKDGKITQAEIDGFRAAQAKAADTDGDGLMSAAELAALQIKSMSARANDRAAMMIERLDTDGDGKLSAVEMTVRPMPARMMDRLDTDNDGALTQAEIDAARDRMAEGREDGPRGKRGHGRGHGDHGSN